MRAGSSDAADASAAPSVSRVTPCPVKSTGSNTCGALIKTALYSIYGQLGGDRLVNRDQMRVQLTELKVFPEALPKCGELTGSYHGDEYELTD